VDDGEAGVVAEGVEAGDSLFSWRVMDADGEGGDLEAGPEGAGEDFYFEAVAGGVDVEIEGGGERVGAEAGLGVEDSMACFGVDPEVGEFSAELAGLGHVARYFGAVAEEDGVGFQVGEEAGDVLGEVLAIGVEGDEVVCAVVVGVLHGGEEGGAFAAVGGVAEEGDLG